MEGDEDGKLECPTEGSDDGPEEDALLKLQACWKATKRAVPKLQATKTMKGRRSNWAR